MKQRWPLVCVCSLCRELLSHYTYTSYKNKCKLSRNLNKEYIILQCIVVKLWKGVYKLKFEWKWTSMRLFLLLKLYLACINTVFKYKIVFVYAQSKYKCYYCILRCSCSLVNVRLHCLHPENVARKLNFMKIWNIILLYSIENTILTSNIYCL